jgi:DNA-binding NtrC family response regulator
VSKSTLDLFQGYAWPGNIRELQNVVERAVVLCEGEIFCVDPSWLAVENALHQAEGLISGPGGAAAKLGLPRQTLESKIRKLGINRHRFRTASPRPRFEPHCRLPDSFNPAWLSQPTPLRYGRPDGLGPTQIKDDAGFSADA